MLFRHLPFLGLTALLACGGDSGTTPPPVSHASIQFTSGNGTADSVDAVLTTPLTFVVHDSAGNVAPPGITVTIAAILKDYISPRVPTDFEATILNVFGPPNPTGYQPLIQTTTDAAGAVQATIKLGRFTGTARLIVSAPQLGVVDTARFTVQPGAAAGFAVAPADTAFLVGGTYTIKGGNVDRYGHPCADPGAVTWTGNGITISPQGVVTASNIGRYTVTVHSTSGAQASGSFSIVPAGAIVADQDPRIVTFNLDGSGFRTLTSDPSSFYVSQPRWIPGSHNVVFAHTRDMSPGLKMVTDAGVVTNFLTALPNSITAPAEPSPSADGKWIYFGVYDATCSTTALCLYRATSGGASIQRMGLNVQQDGTPLSPSPSPDGGKVAFVTDVAGYSTIRVYDATARRLKSSHTLGVNPSWSPDGAHIAFLSSTDGTLLIMNPDGTDAHPLTPDHRRYGRQPIAWSPDSQWLLLVPSPGFIGVYLDGHPALEIVNVQSGIAIPLPYATGMELGNPSWK